jgi:sugar/nucleoside kinase (ribokinase family)
MSLLVVGSIAIDDVKTPFETRTNLLGGSASYAAVSASFFVPVRLVGVVGNDFPAEYRKLFQKRGIDLEGLQVEKGKTFHWSGEYLWDLNQRKTLSVELNVFEHFRPVIPKHFQDTPYILLGNIAPALQMHVLDQIAKPQFVLADTMDLWIENTRADLMKLLPRVDAVCMNDSEARELTGCTSLVKAGQKLLSYGPRYAIIKKGEHGCLLFSPQRFFSAPAYPLEDIHDPTGAGDSFAGAFMGYLASVRQIRFETLCRAVVCGSTIASFNVEAFSLEGLVKLSRPGILRRYRAFKTITHFDDMRLPTRSR